MPNWAIIIGIDQYWLPAACLKGAVNDAITVGEWLVRNGDVPERNVYYLLGPTGERTVPPELYNVLRPTHANFVTVIDRIAEKSGLQGERFYFHYSGHGLSCRQDGRDEQALVPEDFTDKLTTLSFSLRSILEYFAVTQFQDQFFFIDACRNIPWEGEFRIGEWPTPLKRDAAMWAPQQFVFYATSPGVKAREIGEAGNERGAFTGALLEGLNGEARAWDHASQQFLVRVNSLFTFVEEKVRSLKVSVPDKGAQDLIQIPRMGGERGSERGSDPVLARFQANITPHGLLGDGYTALQAEFSRIEQLIQFPSENCPFRSQTRDITWDIQLRFRPHLMNFRGKLREIEHAIEEGNLQQAWRVYGEARSRQLPALANDLLAAIGGFYLREHNLDDAGMAVNRRGTPSFSTLAEQLVEDDLVGRTGEQAYPVLIVGEERPDGSGAVIRLRFPAWDIWNLPLTAHEYGYLLSLRRREVARLNNFGKLCDKVWEQTDPTHRPDTAECFLPEVRQFWSAYDDESIGEGRQKFMERNQLRLLLLQEHQQRFVCRLFADAFATLFGGPAYLYSLLHLRFWPTENVTPDFPPFGDRFGFTLEILKRMSDTPKAYRPHRYRGLFGPALSKLLSIWADARKDAGVEAGDEEEVGQRYKEWLDDIYNCFDDYTESIEKTYEFVKQAESLEKVLRNPEQTRELWFSDRPNVWTVLNAAWMARSHCTPAQLDGVIGNALSLLEKSNTRLIRPPALGQPPDSRPAVQEELRKVLEPSLRLQGRFDTSLEKGVVDPDVNEYLAGRGGEWGALYQFLIQEKKGKQER